MKAAIDRVTPNIAATGITLESDPAAPDSVIAAEIALRADNGRGPFRTEYDRRTDITKSGSPLEYEMAKPLPAWLGGTSPLAPWEGRLYRDGDSWGVVYQDLPKRNHAIGWLSFFSSGGEGHHDKLTLNKNDGSLTWARGTGNKRSPLSQLKMDGVEFYPSAYSVTRYGKSTGSFYGIRGVFVCNPECELIINDNGATFSLAVGNNDNMIFTPYDLSGAAILPESVPTVIPPHFHFGYWLSAPETDGGSWSIEPFAVANFYGQPISDLNSLSGTARYSGPATGVYAIPGQGQGGVTGQFYAYATLTANWGNQEVSGTVNKFHSLTAEDHSVYIMDWSLNLAKHGITQGSGPNSPPPGTWSHRFWGQDSTASNAPTAVTGEFTGHFNSDINSGKPHAGGSVVGAFVVRK